MTPELIAAVKERVALGYSDEAIRTELSGAGYSSEVINQVLSVARGGEGEASAIPTVAVSSGPGTTLPGVGELFSNAWSYVFSRLDLLLYLAIPAVLLGVAEVMTDDIETAAANATVWSIVGLLALVTYVFFLIATVYTVAFADKQEVTFQSGLAWARKSGLGLIWVFILTVLVSMGGFVLLIIPGIIVSIMIYFSQYVYVREGVHGLGALLRSRELVKGNWGGVFGRLFMLGLLAFLIQIVLQGIFFGVIATGSGNLTITILGIALSQLVGVAFTIFGFHVGMGMYLSLASVRPEAGVTTDAWKYKTLAWFGLMLPVLGILAAIVLASLNDAREQAVQAQYEWETQLQENAKERAAELRNGGLEYSE